MSHQIELKINVPSKVPVNSGSESSGYCSEWFIRQPVSFSVPVGSKFSTSLSEMEKDLLCRFSVTFRRTYIPSRLLTSVKR